MKKILSIVFGVLVLLLVVLVFSLGPLIRTAVVTAGPRVAGVPVDVEKVSVNLFSGTVRIQGMVIGNPEGFNTPSLMELGDFKLAIKMASLLSPTVVVREVLIENPQITYERGLRGSNLSALQANLPAPAETAAKPPPEDQPAQQADAGKKVIIEDFQLNGARVNVSLTAMGGRSVTVPLPPVRLQDIGKESDGASPAEVIARIFRTITSSVTDAAAGAGQLTGDALKSVGGAAGDAASGATEAVKDAAGSVRRGIGGLLKREE